jgi:Mrp family chromosome partitioning ATPase
VSEALQTTSNDHLHTIASGALPPNPSELLGSRRMSEILDELGRQADLVIVDSPPFLVTDPFVLASKVDGVLLAVRPGSTQSGAAKAAIEQLHRAEARLLGIIINRIPKRAVGYYAGYRYYSPYYYYQSDYYREDVPHLNGKASNGSNGLLGRFRQLSNGKAAES